jgi:hypothetical protein
MTKEYLYSNDELIDMAQAAGLYYSPVDGLWHADSVALLQFIGKIEDAYISHYERKIDAMQSL